MIHIVFQESDITVLKQAIALDETMAGDVLQIKDEYAVGPLANLHTPEGYKERRDWWRMLLEAGGDYNPNELMDMVDDRMTVHQLVKALNEHPDEKIWIWAAQNKHDVSGYYWLVSQLTNFQGRIFILYLNNLPFINDKGGIFYPVNLFEIPAKEFLKAKKLARPITASEFEIDPDEWKRICAENKWVRLLEGGKKLTQANEDHYDAALAKYVTGDFIRANRILQQFYTREKETTGDVYLLWRLKKLIEMNSWEVKGDISKGSKEFELRNPALPSQKKKATEEEEV